MFVRVGGKNPLSLSIHSYFICNKFTSAVFFESLKAQGPISWNRDFRFKLILFLFADTFVRLSFLKADLIAMTVTELL